ncbi:MAG: acetoacetyl-CoA synthase [Actinomycetia bacterium]|jgi:acetoacetyl-CoA synthetase|nr:acetoacetyl-CoA synthase [Actinomycetes bacterium]
MANGDVLWTPPSDVLATSRIGGYLRWLRDTHGLDFRSYEDVRAWSVRELGPFWQSIWDYFAVSGSPGGPALGDPSMPGARWFEGSTLNYAEHVLRAPGMAESDPVVLAYSQTRGPQTMTVAELRDAVRRAAAGLRRLGVGEGDRVAAYLPNIPETVVLFLATASLGAIFSSCAPEFGTRSVTDRWQQIGPKVLVAVDGYRYGGKAVDRSGEVAAIRAALPSTEHVVGVRYLGSGLPGTLSWDELCAETSDPLEFAPVPFAHPLYVLYSSGTTGLPKPIVHGHGGILLEHLKTLALHMDLGPGDRFFWFSTTGWMMWNLLVSGPAVGAAIVLFDGNPGSPGLGELWRLAERARITYFGTSAPFLVACRGAGVVPAKIADLSRLRSVGSTGAPLPPEGYRWVYDTVGPVHLQSVSGGTDVCTAFVGAVPLVPVYEGEISCRSLGAPVEAFAPDGTSVIGHRGELVLTGPMPSMPVGFWNDPDGTRYTNAYFGAWPGVWRHGDWIEITRRGSCVISGRSDATLNRGGVRLGTAEFYAVIEDLPEIADSVVVHLDGSGELLLFVVLAGGAVLDDALRAKLARELSRSLSPRHVPDEVHAVPAVPRTLSGKKLEVPVKRILDGAPASEAAAAGALANPNSLRAFELLREARLSSRRP